MKQNKGSSLIITIITTVLMTAAVFMFFEEPTSNLYDNFASEFKEYSENFLISRYIELQMAVAYDGRLTNSAQIAYCAAQKIDILEFDRSVVVPGGYTSPRFQTDIKDSAGETYELVSPVYEIVDDETIEFYGDANGKETHFVTRYGEVFTLPGFPRTVNGEKRMYISKDLYYVLEDKNVIHASDLEEVEPVLASDSEKVW